jgi:hypothetical protein
MKKNSLGILIAITVLLVVLMAAHHLDLFGLMKRLHGG